MTIGIKASVTCDEDGHVGENPPTEKGITHKEVR